jgi:hypothetical protein
LICIDISKNTNEYSTYKDFDSINEKALLFCAAKHREGSDIKNLDGCVFLDKVENRCPKVFLQCIGRVLRQDKNKNKKYGLVIDVRAKSSLMICNHLNQYLNLPSDIFPWNYQYKLHTMNNKMVKINTLDMINYNNNNENKLIQESILSICPKNKEELIKLFVRSIPNKEIYKNRLNYELDMLERKDLISHLAQAIQILNLTENAWNILFCETHFLD